MKKVLKNVNIIDVLNKQTFRNSTLCIEDDMIHSVYQVGNIPEEFVHAEIIDLSGKTIVPGLINCHVHVLTDPMDFSGSVAIRESRMFVKGMGNLMQHLKSGFVFLRDMGGRDYIDIELRNCVREKLIPGSDMYVSGRALTITGGHGNANGIECDGEDAFIGGVRENVKKGVDQIKIMVTGGVMTPNSDPLSCPVLLRELKATVEAAHALGKKTAAHVHSVLGIKNSILAGIDSIEHGVYMDDEAAEMLVESGTYYVPTLIAPYSIVKNAGLGSIPGFMVEKAKSMVDIHFKAFERALKAGAKIAMGTDSGTPYNFHNESLLELKLMSEAGMNNMDIIIAATKTAAELLGIENLYGSVSPDKKASFVILDADPLKSIDAFLGNKTVYKDGKEVY